MEVSIKLVNIPASVVDWKRALEVPAEELPELTEEQKSFARDFGISETDYARSAWARRVSEALYRRYTEHFSKCLLDAGLPNDVQSVRVTYDGWSNKFYCGLRMNTGEEVPLVFDADIIIRSLQSGNKEAVLAARQRIKNAVEWATRPASHLTRNAPPEETE
jgi:hypothetical protein